MKTKSPAVESKHTPTPWPEKGHAVSNPSIFGNAAIRVFLSPADYAHARHCVNAYDGLVAALENVLLAEQIAKESAQVGDPIESLGTVFKAMQQASDQARAALAQAKRKDL